MSDAEVWLILANGLAGQGINMDIVAEEADKLLIEYKRRFDPDYFKGANDDDFTRGEHDL